MKQWILSDLQQTPCVNECTQGFRCIQASSMIDKAMTLAASYRENPRAILVVMRNSYAAQQLYDRLANLLNSNEVDLYTVEESLRVEAITTNNVQQGNRVEVLNRCLEDSNRILITHAFAMSKVVPLASDFRHAQINVSVGQVLRMDDLCQRLINIGYTRVAHVYAPLTFARRGFVIDVFPINAQPIRIEYFDDEIDSIKVFDVQTQRSVSSLDNACLSVASEYYFNAKQIEQINGRVNALLEKESDPTLIENVTNDLNRLNNRQFDASLYPYVAYMDDKGCLLDYLPNAQIITDPMHQVVDSLKYYQLEASNYLQELVEYKKILPKFALFFPTTQLQSLTHGEFAQFANDDTNVHEVDSVSKSLEENLNFLVKQTKFNHQVIAVNENDIEKVINTCLQLNIDYHLIDDTDELPSGLSITLESYYEGFSIESLSLIVFTANELFHRKNALYRYTNKYKQAESLNAYTQLNNGDYVVHNQYGVGQYIGIVTRVTNGLKKDYLHILYADNGELFVPLEQFHLVRRFVAADGVVPKLNKIGSDTWKKTKAKLKESLQDLAQRLVELYSERKKEIGFAFPSDSAEQLDFENEFEYPLTPDQQSAVDAIKACMELPYPMDYLLAGDVGFGKTEVAIRCAFKAVQAGKQVAVLAPTTLLSRQHYITFVNRFSNYPVNIALLNRFVSPSMVKQTLAGIQTGSVDIVVATHRILSKDIRFKDLGLLIIDEEHRFGVEQKERLAEMKHNMDVLSLSATPIPRTMQMSLMGVRQSSQLTTPPNNRYPVATYVVEHNDKLIKEVMERELARGGQVFYLFNHTVEIYPYAKRIQQLLPKARVGIAHGRMEAQELEELARGGQVFYLFNHTVEIYPYAKRIQQLLPKARVGIAHGRMEAQELETTMDEFIQGNTDILLCTTVIENGIDIPNANTILVDNAHRLGLAQLYQIKGRVGRSTRMGYAYLMIPEHYQLTEVAQKRLNAIKEFANLGDQLYQIKGRVGRSTRMGYAYLMIPEHYQLTEVAQKRLNAIKEFANLGDGYQIAMRDLMIRGAGDLLGAKQSGFINTVGMDMVIEMLKEEIEVAQDANKKSKEIIKKQVLPLNATIPNSFTQVNYDKLDLVTNLENCDDKQSLLAYQDKIKDEYGKLPSEVEELFLKRRFEIASDETKMEKITIGATMTILFNGALSALMDGELLFDTVYRLDNNAKIAFKNGKVSIEWKQTNKKNLTHSIQLMENINTLLKKVR